MDPGGLLDCWVFLSEELREVVVTREVWMDLQFTEQVLASWLGGGGQQAEWGNR